MIVYLVSLGCAKNLVDSEIMLGRFSESGLIITEEPELADIIVINTCGFIEPAINEAIDTILELSKLKLTGECERLIVTGCLVQRYGNDIVRALPEVDVFLGTGAYDKIIEAIHGNKKETECVLSDPNLSILQDITTPRMVGNSYMAYLKISEGCDRHCTYCIIPKLRGQQRSRHPDEILREAGSLVSSGVKELIIIGQDTTNFGKDIREDSEKYDFSLLLEKIAGISNDIWIRVLYGHPDSINEKIINIISKHDNICSYYDIPIQHVNDNILKKMGRRHSGNDLISLFTNIRSIDPEAVLRTTVITGFPGETDTDFDELQQFATDIKFNHLGAFTYSDSEDLASHILPDHVPSEIAKQRHDCIMEAQVKISTEQNKKYKGNTLRVLIEEKIEDGLFIGRTWFQAPEVDGITYIKLKKNQKNPEIGDFINICITDSFEYDLTGEPE